MNYSLTGRNLIAGQWIASPDTFRAVDPRTGTKLEPPISSAGSPEAVQATEAAARAFWQMRILSGANRALLLRKIAEEIEALGDDLIEAGEAETALPQARLIGERGRTCNQLRLFADLVEEGSWVDAVIDLPDPGRTPAPKPDVRRMRVPIGPVVVFDASNFPFAFGPCGGDTASALASGNPVVVKAHPGHPATDELFAVAVLRALEGLRIPAGAFSLLQGPSQELGAALAQHPASQAVGFTGSLRAGRSLFDLAARREKPIPVFAEMGSLNPLVILPGALRLRGDGIAEGLAASVTAGAGQFCTKPGLVFLVDGSGADSFAASLESRLRSVPAAPMLTCGIRQGLDQTLNRWSSIPGLKTRLPGESPGYASRSPALLEISAIDWRAHTRLQEEAFGPTTILVRCTDFADLLKSLRTLNGQLAGCVHTAPADNPSEVRGVLETLQGISGRVVVNGYPTGVEVCHAMVHGGPYPVTTAPSSTSVGSAAIERFTRPVAFQDLPDEFLPPELQNTNPLGIMRRVDGVYTRDSVGTHSATGAPAAP